MFEQITWLHVEPTTRCNAWCSSCTRNKNGYGLTNFQISDLDPNTLKVNIDNLPNLETIQFCGNLGDPCASKLIDEQLEVVKKNKLKLQIHTNGSLRSPDWWRNVAKMFGKDLTVWFAIDGLEDTHKIYRQGTDWKKIIKNAEAFIQAGGNAVWQFIPFKHNEHQLKDCMKLASKMQFTRFEFVKNARYKSPARDYQTGEEVKIEPWSKHAQEWFRKGGTRDNLTTNNIGSIIVNEKDCMHLTIPSLFLNAYGKLTPCCYFENTAISDVAIKKSIDTGNYHKVCLENCGFNITNNSSRH